MTQYTAYKDGIASIRLEGTTYHGTMLSVMAAALFTGLAKEGYVPVWDSKPIENSEDRVIGNFALDIASQTLLSERFANAFTQMPESVRGYAIASVSKLVDAMRTDLSSRDSHGAITDWTIANAVGVLKEMSELAAQYVPNHTDAANFGWDIMCLVGHALQGAMFGAYFQSVQERREKNVDELVRKEMAEVLASVKSIILGLPINPQVIKVNEATGTFEVALNGQGVNAVVPIARDTGEAHLEKFVEVFNDIFGRAKGTRINKIEAFDFPERTPEQTDAIKKAMGFETGPYLRSPGNEPVEFRVGEGDGLTKECKDFITRLFMNKKGLNGFLGAHIDTVDGQGKSCRSRT